MPNKHDRRPHATGTWTMHDGTSWRAQFYFDVNKMGRLVGRAKTSKKHRATAVWGGIVVLVHPSPPVNAEATHAE